ncbi:MAG TPA: nuclear transport factor 2 family protein [Pseudonocardia sp.]|jgi:ketosteroid isomerase-like protein|nr:nuclear transport factor 2 family protein [Pseudonocardia sp.]
MPDHEAVQTGAAERARTEHVALICRLFEAIGALNMEAALATMHESIRFTLPYERAVPPLDKDGLAAILAGLRQAFQRFSMELVEVVEAVDPNLIVVRYEGDCLSTDGTVEYRNSYVVFFSFTDGQISRWREYANPILSRRMNERMGAVALDSPAR